MAGLTGRISWRCFLQQYAAALLFLGGSLFTAAWSLQADFKASFIVAGFTLAIGLASLVGILIWLTTLVTWFELDESSLRFARPFRLRRTISPLDVVFLPPWDLDRQGVRVCLQDGSSFYLHFRALGNAMQLAEICRNWANQPREVIAGRLDRSAVAMTLLKQILYSAILLAISLFGLLLMAVGIGRPGLPMRSPWVFVALALVLWGLCATGFYFLVLRTWLGTIRWYRLEKEALRFRTIFSLTEQQGLVEEISSIMTHRPDTSSAEAGAWTTIRFRDGRQIRLSIGMLPNAAHLVDVLKQRQERRDPTNPAAPPAAPTNFPLQPQLELLLNADEQVYWQGRPDLRKQWNETAAEVFFGALLVTFGGCGIVIFVWTAIANREPSALIGALFLGLFFAIGVTGLAAPQRKKRLQEYTLYAVTNRRVLVLYGCHWGRRAAPYAADETVKTFLIGEVRDYQVENQGRDIVFGGQWIRGRKGQKYWVHQGFLAPDDPSAALAAIRRLLAEHPRDNNTPEAA